MFVLSEQGWTWYHIGITEDVKYVKDQAELLGQAQNTQEWRDFRGKRIIEVKARREVQSNDSGFTLRSHNQ